MVFFKILSFFSNCHPTCVCIKNSFYWSQKQVSQEEKTFSLVPEQLSPSLQCRVFWFLEFCFLMKSFPFICVLHAKEWKARSETLNMRLQESCWKSCFWNRNSEKKTVSTKNLMWIQLQDRLCFALLNDNECQLNTKQRCTIQVEAWGTNCHSFVALVAVPEVKPLDLG